MDPKQVAHEIRRVIRSELDDCELAISPATKSAR